MSKEKKERKSSKGGKKWPVILLSILSVFMAAVLVAANTLLPTFKNVVDVYMGWNIKSVVDSEQGGTDDSAIVRPDDWDQEAANQVALSVAQEGLILLKNANDTLPIDTSAGKVKVNVFGTASCMNYGGSGSGAASAANTATFTQGLQEAGFDTNEDLYNLYTNFNKDGSFSFQAASQTSTAGGGYSTGSNNDNNFEVSHYTSETTSAGKTALQSAIDWSDIAIVAFGRAGSEEVDMLYSDLQLSQNEMDLLNMVEENFDTIIVVVIASNAMELGALDDEAVDAVLWLACPGQSGNRAIGQALNGELNPSGRTADTWAYDLKSAPSFVWFGPKEYTTKPQTWLYSNLDGIGMQNYSEGIYVGYRWYETAYEDGITISYDYADYYVPQTTCTFDFSDYDSIVQFPFGYGLSYTSFDWALSSASEADGVITMEVEVTNVGDKAGKDVVELYYSAPYSNGGLEKSAVVLGDFSKTRLLEPGQSETVTLTVSVETMASYDYQNEKAYILDAGDYVLTLRTDSHHIKTGTDGNELSYTYTASEKTTYNTDSTTGYEVANRFDDALGDITYLSRANGFANFNDAIHVPTDAERVAGAEILAMEADTGFTTGVGETITEEVTTGASNGLVLADLYGLDYNDPKWDSFLDQFTTAQMVKLVSEGGYGTTSIAELGIPATVNQDGPQAIKSTFSASGYVGVVYPSEVVLASTWNTETAYNMGKMVSSEGNHTSVAGWYAPAMDIHRSPMGGRNYEYFSEDGVLSGKIAAAEVQGCQDGGLMVFIKHYAVNEQETNRKSSYLFCNEQAIREIYLTPFMISVKEGGANGVMSAFNRIGTSWAGAHYGLLTEVLRNEWGFHGCVVTDYAEKEFQDGPQGIRAGNDLWLSGLSPAADLKTDLKANPKTATYYLRQAVHNICYMVGNSEIAMNGLSSTTVFSDEISGSEIAQKVINIVGVIYFVLIVVAVTVWLVNRKKKAGAPVTIKEDQKND